MDLSKVPFCILVGMYNKWSNVTEWSEELWLHCHLCIYSHIKYGYGCCMCPAYDDSWCRSYTSGSRLHMHYHDNVETWLNDVREFVGLLEIEINNRMINSCKWTLDDCNIIGLFKEKEINDIYF